MQVGDLIRLRSFDHYFHHADRDGSVTYTASEGRRKKGEPTKVFVAILLGTDELEDPKLDPDAVLQRLGWTPPKGDDDAP